MKRLLSIIIVAIFFFVSCQKQNTQERIMNPADDSTLLSKYVDLDTTLLSGSDTLVVFNYMYDASKRVIGTTEVDYDSSGNIDGLTQTDFFYNGIDTFPNKVVSQDFILPGNTLNGKETYYYAYSNGKLVYDSAASWTGAYIFSYEGNKISKHLESGGEILDTLNTYLTISNGNLISQTFDTAWLSTGGFSVERFAFSYDTHPNPFYNKPNFDITPYFYIEIFSENMFYEKNNPIEINADNHEKYVYTYKSNGYPATAIDYDVDAGSYGSTRKFFYTK